MALFTFAFSLFVDMLWAAAISYGAALVASQFTKKPKQRMPNLGGYPIQTSQKAIAIPKVYGCCRVAGNIIWMGPQKEYEKKTHQPGVDGHVLQQTFLRSFMVGIAEGEGSITKIWNGKTLLWTIEGGGEGINNDTQTTIVGPASTVPESGLTPGTIRISSGDGTQDARFYTGEDFGKYDDLIWVYFETYETGRTSNIPNFSFEVCAVSSYRYTYITDSGEIYGVPLFGQTVTGLDAGGVAVDLGGGVVSLPFANHPFLVGESVEVTGTTNYTGTFTLLSSTTGDTLHITKAYNAEVFDGSETVCKKIVPIGGFTGATSKDVDGNLWFSTAYTSGTCVVKIEFDGTIVTDALTNDWVGGNICNDVKALGDYVYTWVKGTEVRKWVRSTGLYEWSETVGSGGVNIALDADGNVYVGRTSNILDAVKLDADTGAQTVITGFGSTDSAPFLGNATWFNMYVDDDMGVLIGTGGQSGALGEPVNVLYNLCVKDLDGLLIGKMAVGGTFLDPGVANLTHEIHSGNVQTYAGFIYVLSNTPTTTFYKIEWDNVAGTLTVLNSQILGVSALGFYFDFSGNIVVVPNTGNADRLWFYDTDFNFLSKLGNLPPGLANQWGGVFEVSSQGDAIPYPGSGGRGARDENPATIVNDLAKQTRYGAGIAPQYINNASVNTELTYWELQDNGISIAMTEQLPLMDWVDFILSHCNGYRHWSEGQLHLGAFKDKASIVSLDQDDLVREDGDNPPSPVQVVKRKPTETSNLIEMSWIDRENTYDLSVAIAKDDVDRRVSGKVRIHPADLTGIKRKELAVRQAYRLLFEGMYRFSIYSFSVGYKDMLYTVGDMIELSDGGQLVNERMLIIAREEDKDGRSIRIEAVEDISGLYPDIAYETEQTLAVPDVPVGSDELVTGTISFREHVTAPNLYLFFTPGDSVTTGAFIYRSFDGVLYDFVGRVGFDKDTLPNSAGTTTSVLPRAKAVTHRYSESFTVDIGEITSLRTDVNDDEFFQNQSLVKIGDEILAFKTAEDQGSGVWKLTQTIRGLFGTEAVEHPVGSVFATVSLIDLFYELIDEVAGQTIYFKALATAPANVSQTLDNVGDPTEYTVIREHQRPYPLSIQGVKDAGGLITVGSFPVMVEFNLASKEAGFNLGGFGEVPWDNFIKDSRIVGINVTLRTIAGVEILFEFLSLEGYHASDYELTIFEVDGNGNDPFLVEMNPVAALPSSKTTVNLIDIVT